MKNFKQYLDTRRAQKIANRLERADRPTPGAPPPDTTKWPNPRYAMLATRVIDSAKEAKHVAIAVNGRNHIPARPRILGARHEREEGLRDVMREVARGEESVTRAAKALRVSHRQAKALRS